MRALLAQKTVVCASEVGTECSSCAATRRVSLGTVGDPSRHYGMFPTAVYSSPITTGPPPRVQAALQFITMMNAKEQGTPGFDGSRTPSGELTPQEQATYNSAMQMLQQYFSGEMDFGDAAPVPVPPPDDDGQKMPVKND